MDSVIVIGDVHGCYKTLLALVEQLPEGVPLVFVGDLIDRGPMSRQVVQYVLDHDHLCVRGNHEDFMIEGSAAPDNDFQWYSNGGDSTLRSYENHRDHLKLHAEWMKTLPVFLEFPGLKNDKGRHLVVSHSSIGKVWDWNQEKRTAHKKMFEEFITWGRSPPEDAPGIYNIFGHTPKEYIHIKSFYANIDNGAVFKARSSYGKLYGLQFPEMKLFEQVNCDD